MQSKKLRTQGNRPFQDGNLISMIGVTVMAVMEEEEETKKGLIMILGLSYQCGEPSKTGAELLHGTANSSTAEPIARRLEATNRRIILGATRVAWRCAIGL
jgi:hypothetical protein